MTHAGSTLSNTANVTPRKILPVEQWPPTDKALWQACRDGTGPGGIDNRATGWSLRRQDIVEDAWGRFLAWRHQLGDVKDVVDPASRITSASMTGLVEEMTKTGLAPVSIAMHVGALCSLVQALQPAGDWGWLKTRSFRLKRRAKPVRKKWSRVVPSPELYTLGIDLMATAAGGKRQNQPFFAASQYRDGLMVALLAARPLRIRNFQDIELTRSLVHRSGTYWLVFSEEETKTGRPVDVEVPNPLVPYLEYYLRHHRPVLLNKRPKNTTPTTALWLSRAGEKMLEPAMRNNIERRTAKQFGHPINPHLFRDCAATSFATDDPEHVRCIAPLLGHTTFATAEKYYNQAPMLSAVRAYSNEMLRLRSDLLEVFDNQAVREFLVRAQCLTGDDDGI